MKNPNRFNLKGRTALVTGSRGGIGRAIALALAEAGADLVLHDREEDAEFEDTAARAREFRQRVSTIDVDLIETDAADQMAASCGQVDILVLNASIQYRSNWHQASREEFEAQARVNLGVSLELIQRFAPGMSDRGWGRILTLGSIQQHRPSEHMPVYAALKAAQMNLVVNLARSLAPSGVTINNLSPGVIETARNEEALSEPGYRAEILEGIPASRFGDAQELTGAAMLLCSDAGAYITGVDLKVDGGMSL